MDTRKPDPGNDVPTVENPASVSTRMTGRPGALAASIGGKAGKAPPQPWENKTYPSEGAFERLRAKSKKFHHAGEGEV